MSPILSQKSLSLGLKLNYFSSQKPYFSIYRPQMFVILELANTYNFLQIAIIFQAKV